MTIQNPALPGLPSAMYIRVLRDDGITYVGASLPVELFSMPLALARLSASAGLTASEIARIGNIQAPVARNTILTPVYEGQGFVVTVGARTRSLYVMRDDGRTWLEYTSNIEVFGLGRAVSALAAMPGLTSNETALINAIGGGATSAVVTNALLIAGTNGRVGDGSLTLSGTNTEIKERSLHVLGFAASTVAASVSNWFCTPAGEQVPTSNVTMIKASREWKGVGIVPLTWSGSRTPTITAVTFEFLSDELKPASFGSGLSQFPRDAVFFDTYMYSGVSTQTIATGLPMTITSATGGYAVANDACRMSVYDPVNRIDDVDTAGAKATPTGASQNLFGLPRMFLARPVSANAVSCLVVGDSISVGLNEAQNPIRTIAGYGIFDRATLDAATFNSAIPIGHSSRQTESLGQWMASNTRRRQWFARCSVVILEHGTNDISANGAGPSVAYDGVDKGGQQANLAFNFNAFWSLVAGYSNVKRRYQTALLPRPTSSSDTWTTKAGQTVAAGWATGGARDTYETFLATKVTDTTISAVVDIRTAVADGTDNHYWFTNGTVNYMTSDGTHPQSPGAIAAAVPLRSLVTSITLP